MDNLALVLKEIEDGKTTFEPNGKSNEAILEFQDQARCLIKAEQAGYIEKTYQNMEPSASGSLVYTRICVARGLTYDGKEYLDKKWTQQTESIANNLDTLGSARIQVTWRKCLDRLNNDPEGAITSSRSLIEDVLKHLLDSHKIEWGESETLQQLFKKALKTSAINNDPLYVKFMGSCNGVVSNISEIRNRDGDAHGRGSSQSPIDATCTRLVVNVSGALASFIAELNGDENQLK